MSKLRFEIFANVNYTYPYICVYQDDEADYFMEIGLTDHKEVKFVLFPPNQLLALSLQDMENILGKAKEYAPEAIANEESFREARPEHTAAARKAWPDR